MTTPDKQELRNVLGAFVTGVTVVTTVDTEGRRHGVTANSFSSVSLDPPLILWSQSITSRSFGAFKNADRFAINILADDQIAISNRFAKSGDDKFNGVPVTEGLGQVPIIDGVAAHLECSKVATYPGGDHVVFLGRVERFSRAPRKPLAFGGGKYMVAYAHDLGDVSIDLGMASLAHVDAVRVVTAALPELCQQFGHTLSLAVWGNKGPTVIRWEPSKAPVSENLRTGLVLTVTQSATGQAFAAFLPRGLTQDLIDGELQARQGCVDEFESKLSDIRTRGMARSAVAKASPLHQVSINAFTAPVFDASGLMLFALTVTAHASAMDADWDGAVPQSLNSAARGLSKRLGYDGAASA